MIKSPYLQIPDDKSELFPSALEHQDPDVDIFSNFSDFTHQEDDDITDTDDPFDSTSQEMQELNVQTPDLPDHIEELEEQFLGNLKDLFKQWGKNMWTRSQTSSAQRTKSSWQTFKNKIVAAAEKEWIRWDRGQRHETNPKFQKFLLNYYLATGTTVKDAERAARSNLNKNSKRRNPWSAAFISYIMTSAGAGNKFKYSKAHYTYMVWAKKNRMNQSINPFWLYDLHERKPEPGDLICHYRGCVEMTFDNIDSIKLDPCHQVKKNAWWSHCDIVVDVQPAVRKVYVIGGNTGNNKNEFGGLGASTVGKKWRRLDANGYLARDKRVFAIIGVGGTRSAPDSTASNGPSQNSSAGSSTHQHIPAKIQQYDPLIQSASSKYGVDPSIIRAIIAAESGGDPKRTSVANYKGLMQSGKTDAHYLPEFSIEEGTKKFAKMRKWIVAAVQIRSGINLKIIASKELAKIVLAGYNAGHVTVIKAIQYAATAGTWKNWHDAAHYQRALVFSGGYHRYKQCMKSVSVEDVQLADAAKRKYSGWKKKHGGHGNWRQFQDPPPLPQIQSVAPSVMLCWVGTKHKNTYPYLRKFERYL